MRRWLGAGWGRSGYPPDEVVAGQGTAAAKIRALAEAGYDRAEISKPLGIRYQHVRTTFPRVGVATGPRPMS
jgi:hypothetical protein